MNRFTLIIFFCLSVFMAKAQLGYFIYIQTENQQPFFVKMDEKISVSSKNGFLILSKLSDSTYNFSIGFPDNKWPEQKFSVAINRKDRGYLLKNFGEKGWGLFDLQSLAVQMSAARPVNPGFDFAVNRSTDPFTVMLSKAANDPALLYDVPLRKEEKKAEPVLAKKSETEQPKVLIVGAGDQSGGKETVQVKNEAVKNVTVKTESVKPESKVDVKEPEKQDTKEVAKSNDQAEVVAQGKEKSTVSLEKPEVKDSVRKDIIAPAVVSEKVAGSEVKKDVNPTNVEEQPKEVVYQRSRVTRRSESSTTEGFGLVFIDEGADGVKDTVRILIPSESRKAVVAGKPVDSVTTRKFLDIKEEEESKVVSEEGGVVKVVAKNDCNQIAEEGDFMKLRKKMASQSTEEKMIDEARKAFKSRCYTTEQVKNLGSLFLTNGGKYRFFDLAYSYVSDVDQFPSLQSELSDEYFINRFKAMLRN